MLLYIRGILIEKFEVQNPLERSRCRWVDNVKVDLEKWDMRRV